MISKELLSEVLGKEFTGYKDYVEYSIMNDTNFMSPHDLAHKCKEWARDKKEYLHTFPTRSTGYICTFRYCVDGNYEQFHEATTEPEAVFKACEWVLKQNIKGE